VTRRQADLTASGRPAAAQRQAGGSNALLVLPADRSSAQDQQVNVGILLIGPSRLGSVEDHLLDRELGFEHGGRPLDGSKR
jgi:hypothetical protein